MTNRRMPWLMHLALVALLTAACTGDAPPDAGENEAEPPKATPTPAVPVADAPPQPEIAALAEAVRVALQEYDADASIRTDGATLHVARKSRTYMVYERGPNGAWATELTSMLGPEHDGLLLTVTVHDGFYTSDLPREKQLMESRPNNYVLGRAERGPYATTYRSMSSLDLVDRHIRCTFVIGQQTEIRMIQALHRAVLDECARRQWLSVPPGWPRGS